MPKNDNPHSIRLCESVLKYSDEKTAKAMMGNFPLSKSANIDKKFVWAENICVFLENEFDDDSIKSIRMDCACGPETGKIGKLKKAYQSSANLNDFAEKATKQNHGFSIEYDNESLYLVYPQCYCSCVKRVDKPISKTWCYCTLGYTKKMFEYIIEKSVSVELLESVKTGGSICKIKVRIL